PCQRGVKQRRDRPALDDLKRVVDQAPFDVLGAAEVCLDQPAELRELRDLPLCQRRLPLTLRLNRPLLGSSIWRRLNRESLGGDRLGVDSTITYLVDIRVHQARNQ